MTNLATQNNAWGFWGTTSSLALNGALACTTQEAWEAASETLREAFRLTPEQTRDLLDSTLGRHLADDLTFIEGKRDAAAIRFHIAERTLDRGWRRSFLQTIARLPVE